MGEILGVSFQQVQKYERGTNRIAVTVLVRAASALETPMSFFFDWIDDDLEAAARSPRHQQDAVVERSLTQIEDRKVRAALRTLIRALVRT